MLPALQRLVARLAARELRILAGSEAAVSRDVLASTESVGHRNGACGRQSGEGPGRKRGFASIAVAAKEEDNREERGTTGLDPKLLCEKGLPSCEGTWTYNASKRTLGEDGRSSMTSESQTRLEQLSTENPTAPMPNTGWSLVHHRASTTRRSYLGPSWKEEMWTHQQLDFQTNLEAPPSPGRYRFLDSAMHRHDLHLWALFLRYRKRIYGSEGVRMFWVAMSARGIRIPTSGSLADQFWSTFVDLGLGDAGVLKEILNYADTILRNEGKQWTKLYSRIVSKFLTSQRGHLAQQWHAKLIQNYPPGQRAFAEMCHHVVIRSGDLTSLKNIYLKSPYRNIYAQVIPTLCDQGHYKAALKWHKFLIHRGDVPSATRLAHQLVQYLNTYEPANAENVIKDLAAAGVASAGEMSQGAKISREMMNLIHGKTFNIPVKEYNDEMGARWFATQWISSDAVIKGVIALGVQEIGPLSLQAMALRESQLENIYPRIEQLKAGGVSIGKTLYARAVESFSRDGKFDFLAGLLSSDQHPGELEDFELQENLLLSYARAGDWPQYRRTLEIRLIKSPKPEVDKRNIELRIIIANGDSSAILDGVEDMVIHGIEFKRKTIVHLIRSTLGPRRPGRHPTQSQHGSDGTLGHGTDLDAILTMLKSIVRSGSFVEPKQWHEIIRRLGMTGQLQTLGNLCLWLASMYGPANTASGFPDAANYRVPASVPTSNLSHPLRTLFPPSLQRAIIEWGFITNIRHQNPFPVSVGREILSRAGDSCSVTFGIHLLQRLNKLGVEIDGKAARKAIFDRLITYYGPGVSNRPYNETFRHRLGALERLAREIDRALGGEYFSAAGVGLSEMLEGRAMTRLRRIARRNERNKRNQMKAWNAVKAGKDGVKTRNLKIERMRIHPEWGWTWSKRGREN
ncbi:hypothetical protein B2J93_3722 [Marssonina coronariae]|uniref:Pentatricopeptide repeat domain-containing protein n=1 Tax=Diplocarpon coronariae TaxID=2795749 RepID=A0A218YWY3_9HELO|nr:hypothetical protein B2J93_3722 [Marssonina coronariae]